jgi:hypothetical protein
VVKILSELCRQCLNVFVQREISRVAKRPSGKYLGTLRYGLQSRGLASHETDRCASSSQTQSYGFADAGAGSCNDSYLVFESLHDSRLRILMGLNVRMNLQPLPIQLQ